MTTLLDITETCYVCGATHEYTVVRSTNRMGSPDLDTRPPEMMRSTMRYWLRRCRSCGYCVPTVSEGADRVEAIVRSEDYQQLVNDPSYSELANRFRGWAMILEATGTAAEAGWAYMRAAWACDDAGTTAAAIACRSKAIASFKRSKSQGASFAEQVGAEEAILADLLRRSGDFAQTIEMAQEGLTRKPEEKIEKVLAFEIELARRSDTGCYLVTDAFGDTQQGQTLYPGDIVLMA